MQIIPPGDAAPPRLRPREKWILRGVGAGVAALAVALVIAFAVGGHRTGRGCISVALAYSTGGEQLQRCGAAARALCDGVGKAGGVTGAPAQPVARACRRAGLTVG